LYFLFLNTLLVYNSSISFTIQQYSQSLYNFFGCFAVFSFYYPLDFLFVKRYNTIEVYYKVKGAPMKTNLKNTAYNILKERLINCDYAPGSMLVESELALELGISRTPLREAISLLESEKYLVIAPKKGIFVTDISLNDVLQIFQVRMEIEPVTLKMAGPNLSISDLIKWRTEFENTTGDFKDSYKTDAKMHLFIIEHCYNNYLIDMMNTVFDKNARIVISSKQNSLHFKDAKMEHIEILNSLINQNFELAANQMYSHVVNCRKAAIDHFYGLNQ